MQRVPRSGKVGPAMFEVTTTLAPAEGSDSGHVGDEIDVRINWPGSCYDFNWVLYVGYGCDKNFCNNRNNTSSSLAGAPFPGVRRHLFYPVAKKVLRTMAFGRESSKFIAVVPTDSMLVKFTWASASP
jgi:hypothetical protein